MINLPHNSEAISIYKFLHDTSAIVSMAINSLRGQLFIYTSSVYLSRRKFSSPNLFLNFRIKSESKLGTAREGNMDHL